MTRPCFLVIDAEFAGSISTRKLVIESAKFNVITAYSSAEALETLRRFPAVDAAVVDARVHDIPFDDLLEQLKDASPHMPIVAIALPGYPRPLAADYVVDSLNPKGLLDVLQKVCPTESEEIARRDRDLELNEM